MLFQLVWLLVLIIAPSINYNSSLTNLVSSATWHFDLLHREQLARSLGSEWRSPMCLKCSSGRGLDLHCILKVIILALDIMPLGPNTNLFNPFTWSKDTSVSKSLSVDGTAPFGTTLEVHLTCPWHFKVFLEGSLSGRQEILCIIYDFSWQVFFNCVFKSTEVLNHVQLHYLFAAIIQCVLKRHLDPCAFATSLKSSSPFMLNK